jgi:hypothetical protein
MPAANPGRTRGARARTSAATTALGLVTTLVAVLVLPATGAAAAPPAVTPGYDIEAFSPFQGQTACEAISRTGVTAFRALVLAAYPETRNGGIVRTCSIRGASEHKEGRAWDWMVDVDKPLEAAAAEDLIAWLTSPDEHGNQAAMARRLGVMYIIWNAQIWKSYQADRGWQPYRGTNAHTDHVHISFSWAGALQRTSYWTGQVSGTVLSPIVVVNPSPSASATLPPDSALGDPLLSVPGASGSSATPSTIPSPTLSASPSASPTASAARRAAVVTRAVPKASATRSATPKPSPSRATVLPVVKPLVKPVVKPAVRRTVRPAVRRTVKPVVTRSVKPVVKRTVKRVVPAVKPVVTRSTPTTSTRAPSSTTSMTRIADRRGLTGTWRRH